MQAGSGLGLGYNVARAFRQLDLLDELREVTGRITRFEYTSDRGRRIAGNSRRVGEVMQWKHPAAVFVRNNVLARVVSTKFGARKGVKDLQVEF
jgi:hypothetical protein